MIIYEYFIRIAYRLLHTVINRVLISWHPWSNEMLFLANFADCYLPDFFVLRNISKPCLAELWYSHKLCRLNCALNLHNLQITFQIQAHGVMTIILTPGLAFMIQLFACMLNLFARGEWYFNVESQTHGLIFFCFPQHPISLLSFSAYAVTCFLAYFVGLFRVTFCIMRVE